MLAIVLLAGCTAQPISTAPLGGLPGAAAVQKGLVDAAYNLNSAIAVGILPADDPAAACFNETLTTLGIDPTSGAPIKAAGSFVPREGDLISAGSVAYIYAQQAGSLLNGGITVPVGCEALIGKVVLDAARLASKLPGIPMLPVPLKPAALPLYRPTPPAPPKPPTPPPSKVTLEPSAEQIAAFGRSRLAGAEHQWIMP